MMYKLTNLPQSEKTQHIRSMLLKTIQFKNWVGQDSYFKLDEVELNTYDLELKALPDQVLRVTPSELGIDVPEQMKKFDIHIKHCHISSGSPEGGVIRIQTE